MKVCRVCGKRLVKTYKSCGNICSSCSNEYTKNRLYKNGLAKPMSESKDCSQYLGVHIAERLLSKVFDDVTRMPYNNPGYDFICRKGYKIDVKSSVLIHERKYNKWSFTIKHNKVADYFALLAFDNRDDLNPIHFWLVPNSVVSDKFGISISPNGRNIKKLSIYEKPIDKLEMCCNTMKGDI